MDTRSFTVCILVMDCFLVVLILLMVAMVIAMGNLIYRGYQVYKIPKRVRAIAWAVSLGFITLSEGEELYARLSDKEKGL